MSGTAHPHAARRLRSAPAIIALVAIALIAPAGPADAQTAAGIMPLTAPSQCAVGRTFGDTITFEDQPTNTHIAEQYATLGLHVRDDSTVTPMIYEATERVTSSPRHSLLAASDTTRPGLLRLTFDSPQHAVGFYLGNGNPSTPPTATIRAFDVTGTLLGSVTVLVLRNDVATYTGVLDPADQIRSVRIDYDNGATIELDDLCFASATVAPARTFTGRVVRGTALGRTAPASGVTLTLRGSNVQSQPGAVLATATTGESGGYSLSTNARFLYYSVAESALPAGSCPASATPGVGAAAVGTGEIRAVTPEPGTHSGNSFRILTGSACTPVAPQTTMKVHPLKIAAAALPHSTINDDLRVSHIEVNQAIQTATNTVPLVAGKRTAVRVYVRTTSKDVSDVLVKLHVVYNGAEIASGLARTDATPAPNRAELDESAVFSITLATGADLTVGLWAEVDPTNEFQETSESNNRFPATGTQQFVMKHRHRLTVSYLPVHYSWSGWSGPDDPSARVSSAIDWLRSIFPVANDIAKGTTYYPWPGMTQTANVNTSSGEASLMESLNERWVMSSWGTAGGFYGGGAMGDPGPHIVYGWLPPSAYDGNGLSDPPFNGALGRAAFGNDTDGRYRRTMAHEIAHNANREHDERYLDTIGFDALLTGVVKTTDRKDVMWPGQFEDAAWIDTITYKALFDWLDPTKPFDTQTSSGAASDSGYDGAHEFGLVVGTLYPDGTGHLAPVHRDVRTTGELPVSASTTTCVVALNAGGETLARHCLDPHFDHTDGDAGSVGFSVPMLWNPSTARIELRTGSTVLDSRTVSANAPALSITSPLPGERYALGSGIPVSWVASDPDGDALRASVQYSPDGGSTWVPAADGLTGSTFRLLANDVAGTANAVIRVVVTDGVNSTIAQTDGTFAVDPKAPIVSIGQPTTGAVVRTRTAVLLEGRGTDLEDGTLDGASLAWSSSRDGALGTGGSLVVPSLSPGTHTITLTATDADGNVARASVTVRVLTSTPPVTSLTATPAPGSSGWNREPVTITLRATDAEDDVREIRYRIGTGDEVIVPGPQATVQVTEDGVHRIEYRSVDRERNYEAIKTAEVRIDRAPPSARMTTSNLEIFVRALRPLQLRAVAVDTASGVGSVCFVATPVLSGQATGCIPGSLAADGTWTASPNLGPGLFNVTVRATDVAGNQGATSAAVTILVL